MKTTTLTALILATLLILVPGCTDQQLQDYKRRVGLLNDKAETITQQVEKAVTEADAVIAAIDGELFKAREQAEALPDGEDKDKTLAFIAKLEAERDKTLADAKEIMAKGREKISEITASIDALDTALEDADTPEGAAGVTIQEGAPYLPPPWNLVATGIGGLLLSIQEVKRRKAKAAAKRKGDALQSTVEAFEIAKREGEGVIDFNKVHTRATIRGAMSTVAREEVDDARLVMAKKNPVN